MKKIISFITLLALLVSGCSQEEMLRNGTSASGGRIFTTSFENNESRTYLEDGHLSRWTEGDRISLFDANTLNNQYLFGGKTGDTGGSFFMLSKPEGTGSSLAANYAVYPYSEDVVMIREGEISVVLPSEQHYAENSYGLGDNTMVAVTEDTVDTFLQFKNVGGIFKFQLYGNDVNVQSISLMGNNGEKIAGNATIMVAYNETPVVAMADDATTTITLDCGERGVKIGASADKATAFCMVVPPVTFEKGITFIIMDINGKSFTQTTDKKIVIKRNVVKPMVAIKADVTYERVIPEELKDSCLVTNIQVDGADAAKFYEGCFVSSIYDKMPISDGTLELQTNINKKVQTYWLTGKNDEIYMMTRVSNTEKNKSIEFNAEKTAMAFVTFHPFFANIDSLAYDVLEETILQCQNFPKLQAEVKNVIRQKQDLFDQNNTVLFDALGALLEEIMVFTTDDPESQAVSRAITNNTQYFPIRINSSGRRMEFQVFGLNPNYYGTATHANGDVENLVVESDDDFGFLSGLKIINDVLMKKGWTASQYGRKTRYYFPEEGECKFHFSCRTEENQVDLTMRILNSCMDILGGAISYNYSTYFRSKLKEIAFKNSGKVMAYFPYFSAVRYASTGELWSLGYEMLKSTIDFAFDSEIERYKNLRYEWRYSSRRVKYYNNSLANLRSSKALFNKVMLGYTCAKSLVNILARLINAGLAPDNVDFSYCYYNDEIYTCSRLRKYKGDGQTGNYGETLDIPISVMVNVDMEHESISDYIVRFEVTNGGGAVKNEYVEIKDYQASTEWTLGYSSENQSVMAYLCDKETKTEVCEPVEFTAKAEGDPLREALIRLYQTTNGDNWKYNDNWCSDKPITEWSGVSVDNYSDYQKVKLILYNNNLTGYIKQTFPDDVRISLECQNNQLTSLDVSGCSALEMLYCYGNQLTSLDVSACTSLENLWCSNNQLTSLDVSGCSALTYLNCKTNQLTSLDVSGCVALTDLSCSDNQLTSLDVSGCSALTYLSCGNNQLTSLNAENTSIMHLTVREMPLTSLDVSGCVALTDLSCSDNQLTSLDVSGCVALTDLNCSYNQLTSLDVSGCSALSRLYCRDNQLTSLDVSGCSALTNLGCYFNQLTSLDVSGCSALSRLECFSNQLTSLDVSGCSALTVLDCHHNQLTSLNAENTSITHLSVVDMPLTSLNVSGCSALKSLNCSNNQLTSLNVSGCTALETLNCYNNQFTSLNVSGCTALEGLTCENNQLTSLNVSGCSALEYLRCFNNQLISLNVSGCTALESLFCNNNQLTSLNVSGCSALTGLDCYHNQLTSLNVSGCSALKSLNCWNNQLTSLNVSGCTALEFLTCENNQLTSLNVSGCSALIDLNCWNNQLTSLNVSGCSALTGLDCYHNQLTSLNVSGCTALRYLSCYNNQLTSLNVSGCTALETLYCNNNNITSVIPEWFSQLTFFNYDVRFRYYYKENINGEWVPTHEDRGYGWWYPGEPEKGEHSPD